MKKFLLFFFMTVLLPMPLDAETIVLKNGMKFESEKVWEADGEIKCYRNGLVVGFPKGEVERIDKTPPEAIEAAEPTASERRGYDPEGRPVSSEPKEVVYSITPAVEQRSESNVDEIKQRLARIQQELHLEYQALMRELEQLESDKKALATAPDRTNFSKRVLQYNQKAKNYEHKLKAFNKDVEAYKARVEAESRDRVVDNEKFSMMLKRWMHSPIDDFINLWGYPNQIINMPDGSKQYVFMVEIAPLSHRTLLFTTNFSGEIVAFRVDLEKAQ